MIKFFDMIKRINIALILLLISMFALFSAYGSQYIFGLEPCIFCLYQRIPYFVIIILSVIALFTKGKISKFLVLLCGLCFIIGSSIAFYHVGVEQGYIMISDSCDSGEVPTTIEEMTMNILGKTNAPCDKPGFLFLGVSMAGWNLFVSTIAAVATIVWFVRNFKK
jgi:disulfide bond formation protein DsbB